MRKVLILILSLTFFVSVFFMGATIKANMVETEPGSFEYHENVELEQVVLGFYDMSSALTTDGRLFTWGYNKYGVLGDGTELDRNTPIDVTLSFNLAVGETIEKVGYGDSLSVVLTSFGRVFTWGDNDSGQLGNGVTEDVVLPVDITENFNLVSPDKIIDIEIGTNYGIALSASGNLYAWGCNDYSTLGDGTIVNKDLPIDITSNVVLNTGEEILNISAGDSHVLLVTSEGRMFAWGNNDEGEIGNGTDVDVLLPIDITSYFSLEVGETIVQSEAGNESSLAYTSMGRVFTWGLNESGQLGDNTTVNKNTPQDITANFGFNDNEHIVFIDSGSELFMALTNQNRVFGWGYNDDGQLGTGDHDPRLLPYDCTAILGLALDEDILSISISYYHTAVLTSTGRLLMWGYNSDGQLGDGTKEDSLVPIDIQDNFNIVYILQGGLAFGETIVDISLGESHFAALTSQFRLFTWGSNVYGQLGDGTVVDTNIPVDITALFPFVFGEVLVDVELGEDHSMALTSEGRVFTWGRNEFGQLGDDSGLDSLVPILVPQTSFDSEIIASINAAEGQSAALTTTGRLFTWGNNGVGQLGDTTDVSKSVPTEITGNFGLAVDEEIIKIVFGFYHTAVITSDGRLFIWGYNSYGALGNGSLLVAPVLTPTELPLSNFDNEPIVDVSLGYQFSTAMTNTGRLFTWGHNSEGQLGHGTLASSTVPIEVPLSNFGDEAIEYISAGFQHTSAVTVSGNLYMWGSNQRGQLGNDYDGYRSLTPYAVPLFFDSDNIVEVAANRFSTLSITDTGELWRWGQQSIGPVGDETQLRDFVPVQKFRMNDFEHIYISSFNEFYNDTVPVSIFPSWDIGNDLYSITINGTEYLSDSFFVTDGRIDVSVLNTGLLDDRLIVEVDSIAFTEGLQIIAEGFTMNYTMLKDFEAPTFTEMTAQVIEVGLANIDWTEMLQNVEDNSDTPLRVVEVADTVNYNVLGIYPVTVMVEDQSYNETFQTFNVEVVDTTVPEITLVGSATVYVELGGSYTESGATYSDNYDASGHVVIEGDTVDPNVLGTYEVSYDITDSSGNVAETVVRTVIVQDTIPPVVSGVNDDQVYEKGSTITILFAEGTAVLNDEAFVSGTTVSEAGEYILVVTDAAGNTTTTSFTIEAGLNTVLIVIVIVAVIAVGGGGFLLGKKYLGKV